MLKLRTSLIAFCLASACSMSFATAGTVTATLGSVATGLAPGTDLAVNVTFTGGSEAAAYIGQINWNNASVTPSATYTDNQYLTQILKGGTTFFTYCIEGTENVYFGSPATWDGVVALSNAPETGSPATNQTLTAAQINDLSTFWNANYDSIGSNNDLATAFQLGIWEIVSADDKNGIALDNGGSGFLTTGNFMASNGSDTVAVGEANTMLTALKTETDSNKYNLYALVAYGVQDQIIAVPVPLPEALPAGLSLLGCLALVKYRFRRAR